jgi:hypothetical protein
MIIGVGDRFRSKGIEHARTPDQDESITHVGRGAVWWVSSIETERGHGIRPYHERVIRLMHAPLEGPTVEMWVTPEDLDLDFERLER